MTNSPNLVLPLLSAEQALKHVTHNEALIRLDGLVQLSVEEMNLTDPPAGPEAGECYHIGTGATGDWSGRDGDIAIFTAGGWRFATPAQGWQLWDRDGAAAMIFVAGVWKPFAEILDELQNLSRLGVNATADASNKLSVRSNAALFNALDNGSGGSGDIRLTLNRETGGDTATVLFQSGWSGRAEIGLAGSDDFAFKVSADGVSYTTGISIEAATGFVSFGSLFGAPPTYPTVSGGVLTVNGSMIVPAPESGTSDDVDTISGGFDGAILIVTGASGNTLTFRDGTGNLKLGGDRVLDNFDDSLLLVRRGSDWIELAYSNNG